MASKKISQLPEASELKSEDLVPIVQDGENKVINGGKLKTEIGGGDVVGPSSAVANNFVSFSGTSGKSVKDSGKNATNFETAGAAASAVASHVSSVPHPTADEKAALAGTGTPSASNKFVTNDDARMTNARTPTSHTHTAGQITDAGTMATKNDAPSDGKTYGRKDGAWAESTGTGDVAGAIHAATAKSPLADNDEFGIADSAATYGLKKVLWSTIKTALNSLYDAAGAAQYYAGIVASALTGHENTTTTAHGGIVASNDSRLTDARTPTGHNTSHVTGSDIIANAVAGGASGLMSGTDKTKLDGIESSADVTDKDNVAAAIHAATAKDTPVDDDEIIISDSAASNGPKKTLWSKIKSTLKTYFDTVYDAAGAASTVQGNLNTHTGLSTTAHGGIVASGDSRLSDERVPTAAGIATKISAASIQSPLGENDEFPLVASSTLKKTLWSNMLAAIATAIRSGGANAVKLDDLASPDDNTDLNATTTVHGLMIKPVAPSAGWNIPAIANGETAWGNKAFSAAGVSMVQAADAAAQRVLLNTPRELSFQAIRVSDNSLQLTSGANTLLVFDDDSEDGPSGNGKIAYDPYSVYDTSNGKFTPGVAGWYAVTCQVRQTAMSPNYVGAISGRINGSAAIYSPVVCYIQDGTGVNFSFKVYLDADDYLQMYFYHNDPSTRYMRGVANVLISYFNAHLIREGA